MTDKSIEEVVERILIRINTEIGVSTIGREKEVVVMEQEIEKLIQSERERVLTKLLSSYCYKKPARFSSEYERGYCSGNNDCVDNIEKVIAELRRGL